MNAKMAIGLFSMAYLAAYGALGASPNMYDGGTNKVTVWENRLTSKPIAKLRAFLWEHWIKQTPATIKLSTSTIEGSPVNRTFTIAPDGAGVWRLAVEDTYPSPVKSRGDPVRQEKSSFEVYDLKRISSRKATSRSATDYLPNSRNLPANAYHLILLDREGKTLLEM